MSNNVDNKEFGKLNTDVELNVCILENIILKLNPRKKVEICSKILNRCLQKIVKREKSTERLCFATGLSSGNVAYWDVNQNLCYFTNKAHDKAIKCIMNFNENFLITGSLDCTVKLWDSKKLSSKPLKIYKGHVMAILCLLKIDEKRFVSGSNDHTIMLWNIDKDKCERKIAGST